MTLNFFNGFMTKNYSMNLLIMINFNIKHPLVVQIINK